MKFKRFLVMICICSLCICLTANVKARALAFPSASEVLTLLPGVELTGIQNAYEGLTSEQKIIAAYIMGACNNIYLCARGFQYNIPQDETSFKAQFIAMGNLIWEYTTTNYGWKSRVNEVFRQYLSSVIVYASEINTTFETWYQGIRQGGANQLYIPYSKEAFDAWTEWYNDPTGDGIASLGEHQSDWDSGTFYDFALSVYPWNDNNSRNEYNEYILNQSPVIYTNSFQYYDGYGHYYYPAQCVLSVKNFPMPNTLFVLRAVNNSYNSFKYGFDNMSVLGSTNVRCKLLYKTSDDKTYLTSTKCYTRSGIQNKAGTNTIDQLIDYAFDRTPYYFYNEVYNITYDCHGFYEYIDHVILVDNLDTLSNPEEIYDTEGLNIVSPGDVEARYIISPNGLFLSPTWPTADGDPMGFWDIIQDNSFNVDTQEPATDDDFKKTIVNNTTINNYYVTDSDKINVPVEWFENELTDQLATDSIPFLEFARDCIDCLGDLQIYMYGAVVFGLAGGVLKKFLL